MEVAFRVLEVTSRTRNAHTECAHGMRTRAFYPQKLIINIIIIKYIKL